MPPAARSSWPSSSRWPCRRARRRTRGSCAPCPWREPTSSGSRRASPSTSASRSRPTSPSSASSTSEGAEVQSGAPFRPPGESNALEVALQPNLPDGTYSATYRLISADSYPVSGGIAFSIGTPSSGGDRAAAGSGRSRDAPPPPLCGPIAGSATPRSGSSSGPCSSSSGPGARRWPTASEGARSAGLQASASFDRRFRLLLGIGVGVGALGEPAGAPAPGRVGRRHLALGSPGRRRDRRDRSTPASAR